MLHRAALIGMLAVTIGSSRPVHAQEHVTLQTDVLFYGDDTEFRNPFREGETILGAALRAAAAFDVNDRVRLSVGAFGNLRFGDEDAFQLVRPVVALTITGPRSTFVFGTLATPGAGNPPGPDRTGPHRLLPPLQRETLAFDRPYEAGVGWTFASTTYRHELWIDWQRLNTPDHRERFDAGTTGELRVSRMLAMPFQLHVVHEGGQLFASGPVADSSAIAAGVRVHGKPARLDSAGVEIYALGARFVPDRAAPSRLNGAAVFARAEAERSGWRGHLIVWRGKDFIKDEGDPNYLSVRQDGTRYRGTRDYAETGLTRTFAPAPGVILEASGRLHRVERHYEYSFRILAKAALSTPVR
jgi:hypothetical protein